MIIRSFLFSVALVASSCAANPGSSSDLSPATESAPEGYAELLSKYVTAEGVRYAAWHNSAADKDMLNEVVDFYATTLSPIDRKTALAWHLNAYNAWILHNILQKYPTKGPLDGETLFFHGNRITISGRKTSFDKLEQKVIRPEFQEPRIHFALNCASESCPPLDDKPFTARTLDATLERLTREFINHHPQGVVVDAGTVRLSKIFDWYGEDFGGEGKLISYVNQYRESPVPAGSDVEFMDYSWQLNATN